MSPTHTHTERESDPPHKDQQDRRSLSLQSATRQSLLLHAKGWTKARQFPVKEHMPTHLLLPLPARLVTWSTPGPYGQHDSHWSSAHGSGHDLCILGRWLTLSPRLEMMRSHWQTGCDRCTLLCVCVFKKHRKEFTEVMPEDATEQKGCKDLRHGWKLLI